MKKAQEPNYEVLFRKKAATARTAGIVESHFGQQLKRLRSSCGISQEKLGFLAGIHTSYVSKLERGTKSPTLEVTLKIANALGVSGAELLRIVEESMPRETR